HPAIAYLDVGHYESEAVTEELLLDFLRGRFPEVVWVRTENSTSPVRSFVP
ncbi:MAG: NGG1p interacting factor NIF3, partial [Rhodothermales bacterium]|nr:NGG1p interacting factor NIF3 [Rhodothermales bacterium]